MGEAGEQGTVLGRIRLDTDPLLLDCLIEMISTVSPCLRTCTAHALTFYRFSLMARQEGREEDD